MAVRHEFGVEKQSSETNNQIDPQNPINPKVGKPENIDILVSRFLDELSDISTAIAQEDNPGADSQTESEDIGNHVASQFKLPDEVSPPSDPDLAKIDEEIEKSLAELERMTAGSARTEDNLISDAPATPATADLTPTKTRIETVISQTPVDPGKQDRKRPELFRSSVSANKQPRRFRRGWILAGVALMGAMGIAAFFFFSSDNEAAKRVVPVQNAEPAKPVQTSGDIQKPVVTKAVQLANSAEQAKPKAQETRSRPVSSPSRNADTNGRRTPEQSIAKPNQRPPAQDANSRAPAEKPKTSEEPSRPVFQPAAAATVPAPEPSSPAANPPAVPSQPKANPVVPSGTPVNNSGTITAAASATTISEASLPAAPKPTPVPEIETGNNTAQPKLRNVSMAEVLTRTQPVYPTIARTQKISGKVEVDVDVNEKGDVIRAKAVAGPDLLRFSAEQALMKWKFKPASVDGVNVPSKARIIVSFNVQ